MPGIQVTSQIDTATGRERAQESTAGAGHVHLKVDDTKLPVYGSSLQTHVWATPAVPAVTGAADVTFIVDATAFGKATLSLIPAATTMTTTVDVSWSHDGGAKPHSSTNLWTTQTGVKGAAITILDNYAHFRVQRAVASETMYIALVGRQLA